MLGLEKKLDEMVSEVEFNPQAGRRLYKKERHLHIHKGASRCFVQKYVPLYLHKHAYCMDTYVCIRIQVDKWMSHFCLEMSAFVC